MTRSDQQVSYLPETVMAASGGCPVDPVVTLGGQSIAVPLFSKSCGFVVNYVRPMAIMLAAFMAFMIVSGGLKQGGD